VKPLAITLGDPACIGAEIVFKALREIDVPAIVFGSREFAQPPNGVEFVDVGGRGAVRHGCETINGWIEWYDKACLKVNREGAPNLLIQKACIKYMYKVEEAVDG
jgi:hypothetical protein